MEQFFKGKATEVAEVFNYKEHRLAIGILGATFPFTMLLGGWIVFHQGVQNSISAYYYTGMRDVFVGTLWAVAWFLWSYKGYDATDRLFGRLACIAAIGVTLFPTTPESDPSDAERLIGSIHLGFAALFFAMLIGFSLFLFTKSLEKGGPTPVKKRRDLVYRVCGWLMVVCIALIAIYFALPDSVAESLEAIRPVFVLETIAIVAFGLSWFTKSTLILFKDPTPLDQPKGKSPRSTKQGRITRRATQ